MAKVWGALLSVEARGQVGDHLQFRIDRGIAHARHPPRRAQQNQRPPTAAQTAVRARYRAILAAWRALPQSERDTWDLTAKGQPASVSGWNLFFVYQMVNMITKYWALRLRSNGAYSWGVKSGALFERYNRIPFDRKLYLVVEAIGPFDSRDLAYEVGFRKMWPGFLADLQ